ncbi:hypothetical protein FEM48_Zijuj11G0033400 [Ziziphus jujuba var. spinosa]|uniref:Uncharacterized protein n=1 Tax=Ziziphus jujuba var. spinosa TaxID=714518 RepID=A0A978UGI3_ZIZJJ|nr:hypothetical protein FEM48_Zijuj11G0033400 [Ziziphus jujuba var. spinosa]
MKDNQSSCRHRTDSTCRLDSSISLYWVFPSSNMGNEVEFLQRWEFRRENMCVSSSDGSKSSPSSEPAHKKHKLISSLVLLENDEAVNNCSVQRNGEHNLHVESPNSFGKCRKEHIEKSKMDDFAYKDSKRDSNKRVSRKNGKPSVCEAAALDDLKVFMKSLLEDLKVTREDLFTWMKEEMKKLEMDNIDSQTEKRQGSRKGKSIDVVDDLEKNIQVDHQHNLEQSIQVYQQNNLEENIIIQNQNGFKKDSLTQQHQNNVDENLCVQDNKNLKETSNARHQNTFEENIQLQHQSNFKLGMNSGLLERFTMSNEEAGFDNCCQKFDFLAGNRQDSTESDREERLVLQAEQNTQSSTVNHNVLMPNKINSLHRISHYCNGGSLENSVKGKRITDSNCYQVLKHCDQEIESTRKEQKQILGSSIEPNFASHPLNRKSSSMYYSLSDILSYPHYENHIQSTVAANRNGMNSGGGNLMFDSSAHHLGYFSGTQQEDRNRSFARIFPGNESCIDKKSTITSSIGVGLPIPLHQGTDTGFNIPSQISLENLTRGRNNPLGLILDGGAIMFSGGSYALSDHCNSNKFNSHSNK